MIYADLKLNPNKLFQIIMEIVHVKIISVPTELRMRFFNTFQQKQKNGLICIYLGNIEMHISNKIKLCYIAKEILKITKVLRKLILKSRGYFCSMFWTNKIYYYETKFLSEFLF